jgi:hypothetical protein
MGIVHDVSVAAGHVLSGVHAGDKKLAQHKLAEGLPPAIEVRSIAFEPNAALPISCSIDGVGAPPPLTWQGAPETSQSIVLICEDPDAPALEPYLHWLVFGMPGSAVELDAQTQHEYRLGENSKSEAGFTPAAPPPGHGLHHYHFQVFAVDTPLLHLKAGSSRGDVIDAMKGHVLAWGELVGTYQRE